MTAFKCTESTGKPYERFYHLWKPAPVDPWAVEIQNLLRKVYLPQPEGSRLKLKLSADGTVLAAVCYRIAALDEFVAEVDIVLIARHISCRGMGLGEDAMNHFWARLKNDLQGPPTPRDVEVRAIVRPDNEPSKTLMSTHGLTMLVDVDGEGWESWGVRLPWGQASESLEKPGAKGTSRPVEDSDSEAIGLNWSRPN